MDYSSYLTITLVLATAPIPTMTDDSSDNTVARCRAKCANKFITSSTSSKCGGNCTECWDACHDVYYGHIWICLDRSSCSPGCRTGCKFMKSVPVTNKVSKWYFSEKPKVTFSKKKMLLKWDAPIPLKKKSKDRRDSLVYRLLTRTVGHFTWTFIKETLATKMRVTLGRLPSSPELRLIAVSERGAVANITWFPMYSAPSGPIVRAGIALIKPNNQILRDEDLQLINMNVSVTVKNVDGRSYATVTWKPPVTRELDFVMYDINIGRDTCNVDDSFPYCDVPSDTYRYGTIQTNQTVMSYTVKDLTFNSKYWIEISLGSNMHVMSEKVYFYTPGCMNPADTTFERCIVVFENITDDDSTDLFYLNVTSLRFDPDSGKVVARLSWPQPSSASQSTMYSIWYRGETMTGKKDFKPFEVNVSQTKNTHMEIKLLPDNIFQIKALAVLNGTSGSRILYSLPLYLNTTMSKDEDQRLPTIARVENSVQRVVIGLITTLSVILVSLAACLIYRKRHTVREIIITKAAVSKSNSYKSSPGGPHESLADELSLMCDDWELDPADIKVGSLLGQGAFGKVMTGYYRDNKVAIKVLKDNVPLAYKEDLLGEIALMKKLGHHQNIVTLVGACTVREPIALIMEYVPYGNLQSFLKKCRVDGELERTDDGYQAVACSLTNDCGEDDMWTVTPTDMLSFARQSAMAMEYLSEKQYVHRDLAARNVLVGYNKVVKVCDFGLSRDVFLDNQYHKLTSGKLPLKWMALESLKDRIFTTNSDIWSFGVLLWEIVTMGCSPYPNIALADLYTMLADGYRMEKPSNCSDEVYDIMRQCWYEFPNDRPSFTQIRLMLEDLLGRDRDYLELDNLSFPPDVDSTSFSIDVSSLAISLESVHTMNGAPSTSGVGSLPGKSTEMLIDENCMSAVSVIPGTELTEDGIQTQFSCHLPEIQYSQV